MNNKAGSDLLLELVLSAIILTILLVVLYAFDAGQLQPRINAKVEAVDAAVQCPISLHSLMNTPVDYNGNIKTDSQYTWSDLVIDAYFTNQASKLEPAVTLIFDKAFGLGSDLGEGAVDPDLRKYKLIIFTPDKEAYADSVFFDSGGIDCNNKDYGCSNCTQYIYVPMLQEECEWSSGKFIMEPDQELSEVEVPESVSEEIIPKPQDSTELRTYDWTPDGRIDFAVENAMAADNSVVEKGFGITDISPEMVLVSAEIDPTKEYEESNEGRMDDYGKTDGVEQLEFLVLPVAINGRDYEITLKELAENGQVEVEISRLATINNCALKAALFLYAEHMKKTGEQ